MIFITFISLDVYIILWYNISMRFFLLFCVLLLSGCLEMTVSNAEHSPLEPVVSGTHLRTWRIDVDIPLAKKEKTFGLYFWNKEDGCNYLCGLNREIEILGDVPDYVLYFTDLRRRAPNHIFNINADYDIKTVLSQDLRVYKQKNNTTILMEIAEGKWDGYFLSLAEEMRKFGGEIYYRFGYEMNGDWFPWGRQPEHFKLAWKHVWELFREAEADRVVWVFSPSVLYGDLTLHQGLYEYYPGDAYVDVVGVDGYNFGSMITYHDWKSVREVFHETITGLKSRYPHKPLWICEVGSAPNEMWAGRSKSEWLHRFLTYYNTESRIENFIWFNEDKAYNGEANWRLDSDQATLAKFRQWLGTDPLLISLRNSTFK
ncbi:glycoside hydrolase family 26 protein [Fibrobacterota bacterium]